MKKKILSTLLAIFTVFCVFLMLGGCDWFDNNKNEENNSAYTKGLNYYLTDDNTYRVNVGTAIYLSEIVIPETYNGRKVTIIEESAFSNCLSLKKITLPNSIIEIGNLAFYCCYSLEKINIPDCVVNIGNNAFNSCTSLKEILIPNGVTKINYNTFRNCQMLNTVRMGDNVKEIETSAFVRCQALNNINMPSALTIIGDSAFYDTAIAELILPNGITKIGKSAFNNCTSLNSVTIPNTLKRIGAGAFAECKNLTEAYFKITTDWIYCPDEGGYWEGSVLERFEDIPSISLQNSKSAAKCLNTLYCVGGWKHK